MRTKRIIRVAVFVVLILVIFYFAPRGPVEADSGFREVMGTFVRVLVVAPNKKTAQKCIESVFEHLRQVDNLMSAHNTESELAKVNRLASSEPVKVSEETFSVLAKALHFSRLTDGAFDITVGPLIDLWRQSADANTIPTHEEIETARSKVGYRNLLLDANNMTVRFAADGMKLDLGGIAKGYAVDRAVEAIKTAGARGGMVDIGGDIRCFGMPAAKKEHWLIGLQDPNVADERTILTLKLVDSAVATSGDYRRFAIIAGQKHSHIIDANTGQSSEKLSSVTIIADNAADADAIATAVSVLGQKRGQELLNSLAHVEAVLITAGPQYRMIPTMGVHKYIYGGNSEMYKTYRVKRAITKPQLAGDWDGESWGGVEPVDIKNWMGEEPQHQPKTQAKLLYDNENIYVIFRVEDKYVRAVAQKFQDSVCRDSCVEFFFTPNPDIATGYFNLEMNCGGTILLFHQLSSSQGRTIIPDSDCEQIQVYHSEPKTIDPEKQQPVTWLVEYQIPLQMLAKYSRVDKPTGGAIWRANFYKCADKTSRPHWLIWSVVDLPRPDFHRPEFFGTLEFE